MAIWTARALLFFASMSLIPACGLEGHEGIDSTSSIAQEISIDVDLGSGLSSRLFSGTTVGAGNDVASDCGSNGAEDVVFRWVAPMTGLYTFTTAGSSYNTVLQVRNAEQDFSLGCNDDSSNTLQSSLKRMLTAGQVITIVVDGFSASSGSFQLGIGLTSIPPINTTGLQLWARSDLGVTASGGLVSSWTDHSGRGRHATMPTVSRRPSFVTHAQRGWPVIRFNGAQSLILGSSVRPTNFTIFVVGANRMSTESFSMILGPGGSSPNNQLRWENGSQVLVVGTGNNLPVIRSTIGNTRTYHILMVRYDGSTLTVQRDFEPSSIHSVRTTGPWDLVQIGAWYSTFFMQGDLSEIMVYDRAFSSLERDSLMTYLHLKYTES